MVFENLTLFEIQIEGEQFGPRSLGRRESVDDEAEAGVREGSRMKPFFVLAVVIAGLAYGWRRRRTDDEDMSIESESAEADLATAK